MSRSGRKRLARFRQLDIPESQLAAGVYNPTNTLVPWGALATLRLGADELQERLGICPARSYDALDFLQIALLELPSTRHIALVQHEHAPVSGMEIHGDVDSPSNAKDLLVEVINALGLDEDDIVWRRYE